MKKFIEEFKAFALRGNMMDMAVGVIIGGGFTGIVTSLTDNFINPILNFVTGAQTYTLQNIAGFASKFISDLVNFLILAFVLFCLLKGINKLITLGQKKEEPAAPEIYALARSTASSIGKPFARFEAMALDSVHPVPCVLGLSIRFP